MKSEQDIAERVARKHIEARSERSAAFMASGYLKSLMGYQSMLGKVSREVAERLNDATKILQSPVSEETKSGVLRKLGFLSGKLEELSKMVKGVEGLVEDTVKEIQKRVASEEGVERTAFFHPKDDLLRGITFEELIDTVYSNEQVRDERAVKKVFDEILKANLTDAKSELRSSMKQIIDAANQE